MRRSTRASYDSCYVEKRTGRHDDASIMIAILHLTNTKDLMYKCKMSICKLVKAHARNSPHQRQPMTNRSSMFIASRKWRDA
eukprot:6199073-Pleurochrysis_carterae.AAC.2